MFVPIVTFAAIGAIIWFFANFSAGSDLLEDTPAGSYPSSIFRAAAEAEQSQFFVDEAARVAVDQASYVLGQQGGFSTPLHGGSASPCGAYVYSLWNKDHEECFPVLEDTFLQQTNQQLENHLLQYPEQRLSLDFGYTLEEQGGSLVITGTGDRSFQVDVGFGIDETVFYDQKKMTGSCPVPLKSIPSSIPCTANHCELHPLAHQALLDTVQDLASRDLGYRLQVTSAYRTREEQAALSQNHGSEAASATCNAPHVTGMAIDVRLFAGRELLTDSGIGAGYGYDGTDKYSQQELRQHARLESLMCENGWVRWGYTQHEGRNRGGEWWHFEYGTDRWKYGREHEKCAVPFAVTEEEVRGITIEETPSAEGDHRLDVQPEVSYDVCEGYALEEMDTVPSLTSCRRYQEIVLETLEELNAELDPLLVFTLIQQESRCGELDEDNFMQVDRCVNKNGEVTCTWKTIAEEGIQQLKQERNTLASLGATGQELLELTLFSYNRGLQTAKDAYQQRSQGVPLRTAMEDSCTNIYNKECYGTAWNCRYTAKNNGKGGRDKCTDPGLGAGYPETLLAKYEANCKALGGIYTRGQYAGLFTEQQLGDYTLTPHFQYAVPYSFAPYEALEDFARNLIKACTNDPVACVEQNMQEFNQAHDTIHLSERCGRPEQKVLYDVVENIYACGRYGATECYCPLTLAYDEDELGAQEPEDFRFALSEDGNQDGVHYYTLQLVQPESVSAAIVSPHPFAFSSFGLVKKEADPTIIELLSSVDKRYYIYIDEASEYHLALKESDTALTLLNDEASTINPARQCVMTVPTQKNMFFPFCAEVNQTIPVPKQDGTVAQENLTIRFALHLEDDQAPPPVTGLVVPRRTDAGSGLFAKHFAILEWEALDPAPAYYQVYYATTPLEGKTLEEVRDFADSITLITNVRGTPARPEITSYGPIDCTASTCTLATNLPSPQPLFDGAFFNLKGSPPNIVYPLPLPSSAAYEVGVVALDQAMNVALDQRFVEGENLVSIPASSP